MVVKRVRKENERSYNECKGSKCTVNERGRSIISDDNVGNNGDKTQYYFAGKSEE
jgi:hypothetical protein